MNRMKVEFIFCTQSFKLSSLHSLYKNCINRLAKFLLQTQQQELILKYKIIDILIWYRYTIVLFRFLFYTPLVSQDISKTHKIQMWHQISLGSYRVYYVYNFTVQSRFSDNKFSDNLWFSDYFSKTNFQIKSFDLVTLCNLVTVFA